MNDLWVKILGHCAQIGMVPPWIVTLINAYGDVMAIRMDPGKEPEVLAEHLEAVVRLPMTMIVIDQHNETHIATVGADGITWN
jgi:hypothetical protein